MAGNIFNQIFTEEGFTIWKINELVNSEEDALEAFLSWGLIPSEARCPDDNCGQPMHQENRNDATLGFRWRCRRAIHGGRTVTMSALSGTFFERGRRGLSFLKIFRLMYHFFVNDKVTYAATQVEVSGKTAVQYYHYFREVMEVAEAHDAVSIGGPDDIVEMDECHLFTPKYHRGRALRLALWCFAVMSRTTGNLHVELIIRKDRATLDPIIAEHVVPGSFVMTDELRTYRGVDYRLLMRGHATVNHSQRFVEGVIEI